MKKVFIGVLFLLSFSLIAMEYTFDNIRKSFSAGQKITINELASFSNINLFCVNNHEDGGVSVAEQKMKIEIYEYNEDISKKIAFYQPVEGERKLELKVINDEIFALYPPRKLQHVTYYDAFRIFEGKLIIESSHKPYCINSNISAIGEICYGYSSQKAIALNNLITRAYTTCFKP